jgi:TatD DNase family protein
MELFDTHCHIDLEAFAADRAEVLADARAAGVRDLLVPAVQRRTWPALLALCAQDAHLHPALGLHPVFLEQHRIGDLRALADRIDADRPVAVGEIGLDWHLKDLDRERQQRLLEGQLEIAEHFVLPVALHVRKAHDTMLGTLARYRLCGGFCHAFNGSLQQAARYREMGFCLGFGGMLTFERSRHLRRLVVAVPIDAIVLETDAPDMTVASHQYQRNSPAYLPEVLETMARLRGMSEAELAQVTRANAHRVLGL